MTEPAICPDPLHDIHACTDVYLPEDLVMDAARRAVEENPENAPRARGFTEPEPFQLALLTGNKWQNGRTIRFMFMDGDPIVQQKVAAIVHEWSKHANIKFQLVTDPNVAEIRISFKQQGSWSYLGTDCLSIAKNQPTMNYGWLQPNSTNETYTSVVLHEFGHALGCIHEHQNPGGTINWNKEAAYQYYGRQGWSREMVDRQVFQKYQQSQTQFTQIDAKSIMMYPIPKSLTTDGFEAGFNAVLSAMDKQFIAQMYPITTPPPPPPPTQEWRKVVQGVVDTLTNLLKK